MKKIVSFFSGCFLLLASCQSQNEQEIPLFNSYKFHTDSTEKITAIDSLAKLPYIQYFNNIDDIQIPLYRIISGKEYTIYLGIPFHTSLQKITVAKLAKPNADSVLAHGETPESYYRQYKKGNLYFAEYLRNIDSVSMICVFATTDKIHIADTLLNQLKLSNRIKK